MMAIKNLFKLKYLLKIILVGIYLSWVECNSISDIFQGDENNKLKNENASLKFSLDSLSNSYDSLYDDYASIKNKKPDTVFISIPIDSIKPADWQVNWIVDSLKGLPDSSRFIRYILKDSIVLIPHDTSIIHLKDSLVYNYY